MLLFSEAHGDIDALGGLVYIGLRLRGEIDEPVLAISLAVVIQGFANLGGGEDIAFLEGENALERIDFEGEGFVGVGTDDFQRAHLVALTFLDGDGDIDGFAVAAPGDGNAHAEALGVDILEDGSVHDDFEIAIVLIEAADADFEIFVQFFAVVRFRKDRNVPEIERNGVRAVVAHGANELAIAEGVIAGELDAPDLHLGPFLDFKDQDDGVAGGDALVLRRNFCELPAMFAEQLLEHDFGFFNARGVKLTFHGEADLALLEAVENVGF